MAALLSMSRGRKSAKPSQGGRRCLNGRTVTRRVLRFLAKSAWRGFPADPETETSGVGWIRAVDWVPYQRSTFVTPAFAGYVSGHSTFSRAAAEVMTAFTGSPFFPGGLSDWTTPAGELLHEEGPTSDVTLQWALRSRPR